MVRQRGSATQSASPVEETQPPALQVVELPLEVRRLRRGVDGEASHPVTDGDVAAREVAGLPSRLAAAEAREEVAILPMHPELAGDEQHDKGGGSETSEP